MGQVNNKPSSAESVHVFHKHDIEERIYEPDITNADKTKLRETWNALKSDVEEVGVVVFLE